MLIVLSILLICMLFISGTLWINSTGKAGPFLDESGNTLAGSISEKNFVTIGGLRQGMFIKSKNRKNPVLLYIHGGLPDYFLTRKYPTGLEDYFTVVWWEQRGFGLSYTSNLPAENRTLDRMVSDTKELTNYLRTRFGQGKIYLLGRSGGSFIGIQVAASAPELYHAYMGIGQMSDQLESERMAYKFMLEQYRNSGNMKMAQKLEASPVTENIPDEYLKLRDRAMHLLGIGTTRDMRSVVTGMFFPSLSCGEYTLKEKFNLWRSKAQSGVHPLWNEMITTDLAQKVNEVRIPVYFFHGKYDYTVSYPLAKQYLEKLDAPVKGFYTFEKSAHSPMFEEPEKMQRIIREDVIQGVAKLADKN